MIGNFKKTPDLLEMQINAVLNDMAVYGPGTPEFTRGIEELERLTKVKASVRRPRISSDTLVIAGAELLGILFIAAYEQKHVWSSRAFGFRIKRPVSPN